MRIAQGNIGRGVAYADLAQESFLGLIQAIDKFDYREQDRFKTIWVWQKVGRAIRDQAKTIRVPAHKQDRSQKYEQACAKFDAGLEPCVTNPVILFHAGLLDEEQFKQFQRAKKQKTFFVNAVQIAREFELLQMQSISPSVLYSCPKEIHNYDDTDSAWAAIPDTYTTLPETAINEIIIRDVIDQEILASLAPRARRVLELRYGFTDGTDRTLEEVGRLFGLTRERIRQIEKESLARLNDQSIYGVIANLHDLLPDETAFSNINSQLPNYSVDIRFASDDENNEEHIWLDTQLANLPRSNWHAGRHVGSTREEQVGDALQTLSTPSHSSNIAEQFNEGVTGKLLDERNIYNVLSQNENSFVLLGNSVFSLVEWERERGSNAMPILPFCPTPLPDPPNYENAFLESILVGKEQLRGGITAKQFLHNMLQWAKADTDQQKWFLQSILSAYYPLGSLISKVIFSIAPHIQGFFRQTHENFT